MTAIGLIFGALTADHYEDKVARDPRIDSAARENECVEDPRYTRDYLDPEKRSIANAVQVFFKDGSAPTKSPWNILSATGAAASEGMPLLVKKFEANLAARFAPERCKEIIELCMNADQLLATPVDKFMDMFVAPLPGAAQSSTFKVQS